MNFGVAIEFLKDGSRVARTGWNGKGMYVYLHQFDWPSDEPIDPCIVMHTAQGSEQPGWLASQADILAEDWMVIS